jgi:hypothetical protein
MGIFSRHRATAVIDPAWQPEAEAIIAAPGYLMDDDGCASEQAFGARFCLETAPGSTLTVWAYAAYGSPGGGDTYIVGYRVEYEAAAAWGLRTGEKWSAALYCCDTDGAEWYASPGIASDAARTVAAALIRDGLGSTASIPAEWTGWDGAPW